MDEVKLYPIDEKYKIAESTVLIREAFDYVATKRQLDLIYVIISLIDKDDDIFKEYTISFREIAKIYNPANPDSKEIKKYVEEATDKIMDSHFKVTINNKINKYHWVEKCQIDLDVETVSFKLSEEVRQFYVGLKENSYTIYLLKDLLALSTLFQANLFRWLSCNSNFKNKVRITVEDAKKIFYGNTNLETRKLIEKLDQAIDRINVKTNITASYEKVKQGKNIVSLDFDIENNYIKDFSSSTKSSEQYIKDAERKKAMWQENIEMKKKIAELEKQLQSSKKSKEDN